MKLNLIGNLETKCGTQVTHGDWTMSPCDYPKTRSGSPIGREINYRFIKVFNSEKKNKKGEEGNNMKYLDQRLDYHSSR